jgi:transcriptional antiterminator RfaH
MVDQGVGLKREAKRAETRRWYAVQTQPRAEWMVHRKLRQQGYGTLHLHYQALVSHARRKIAVLRAYFPGYLFVEIGPAQSAMAVNTTHGVLGLVHAGELPVEVPARVIEELRAKGDSAGLMPLEVGERLEQLRRQMAPGTAVRLVNGPFAGFLGTVALDDGPELRLWLDLFGRRVKAVTSADFVERLSP